MTEVSLSTSPRRMVTSSTTGGSALCHRSGQGRAYEVSLQPPTFDDGPSAPRAPFITQATRRRDRQDVARHLAQPHDGVVHRAALRAHGIGRHDVRNEVGAGRWAVAGRHTVVVEGAPSSTGRGRATPEGWGWQPSPGALAYTSTRQRARERSGTRARLESTGASGRLGRLLDAWCCSGCNRRSAAAPRPGASPTGLPPSDTQWPEGSASPATVGPTETQLWGTQECPG